MSNDADRAVFCEKPISQEESGIRACYEQAEKANKPLFCAFNRYSDCHCLLFFTVKFCCSDTYIILS